MSQVFWLFILFIFFYFFILLYIIPKIHKNLRFRNLLFNKLKENLILNNNKYFLLIYFLKNKEERVDDQNFFSKIALNIFFWERWWKRRYKFKCLHCPTFTIYLKYGW